MSFGRTFSRGLTATVGRITTIIEITEFIALRNEIRITSGISWGRTGSLLPF